MSAPAPPRRVGLLTTIPTPYRLPLFRRLAAWPGIAPHVAFAAMREANRHWRLEEPFPFPYQVLPGRTLSLRGRDLTTLHLNRGLRRWLDPAFDAVVIGGWSSPTLLQALLACERAGTPTILWSGSTAGEPGLGRTLSAPLVRRLVPRCAAYVAYGTRARDYLIARGARPHHIALGWNTVDVAGRVVSGPLARSRTFMMNGLAQTGIRPYNDVRVRQPSIDGRQSLQAAAVAARAAPYPAPTGCGVVGWASAARGGAGDAVGGDPS